MKCFEVNQKDLKATFEQIDSLVSGLDEKLQFKIKLICEEAITNQFRHADFRGKKPKIECCFDLENTENIVLIFKDNAKAFNPLHQEAPDQTLELEETKLGGLGILMIKNYSKESSYEYHDEFNILKVVL